MTEDKDTAIAGIPCALEVKYLGVPVHVDPKAQREKCLASVKRNLGHLKWKLRKVDSDIKETLTCVLARSILIYIGTPMVAAGLWKREDIDRTEAQLFRQINGLPNIISNKAIMNVACSMRNAWEIVEPLALRANLQYPKTPKPHICEVSKCIYNYISTWRKSTSRLRKLHMSAPSSTHYRISTPSPSVSHFSKLRSRLPKCASTWELVASLSTLGERRKLVTVSISS